MSFDSPMANQTWAMAQMFQYDLWSDSARVLALYYGAASSPTQFAADRDTRILDADGNLVLQYDAVAGVGTHPQEVLEDCTVLFGP